MPSEAIPLPNINGRNDRFSYGKILRSEQWLFVKTAKKPELEQNLQRELLWSEFVNSIAAADPEAHISAPHIVGFDGNGALLMEYIDAKQVASPSDGEAWKHNIDRYARTLVTLDTHAENYTVQWPVGELTAIAHIDEAWRRWFGDSYEANVPVLQKARDLIEDSSDSLEYRVQHGDLTPWQMFERGDDWVIYDGEKAGDHLPRFNDLAYGYGRLFTRLKDSNTAAVLLEKFIEYSDMDSNQFFKQFLPVMTFRATGMLADAYSDSKHDDYVEQANELMALCLNGRLEDFLPK